MYWLGDGLKEGYSFPRRISLFLGWSVHWTISQKWSKLQKVGGYRRKKRDKIYLNLVYNTQEFTLRSRICGMVGLSSRVDCKYELHFRTSPCNSSKRQDLYSLAVHRFSGSNNRSFFAWESCIPRSRLCYGTLNKGTQCNTTGSLLTEI